MNCPEGDSGVTSTAATRSVETSTPRKAEPVKLIVQVSAEAAFATETVRFAPPKAVLSAFST